MVWGICLFGLNLYAQAFCYPRTLYEQFVELKEFPRYYKSDNPKKVITKMADKRVNETSGVTEVLVRRTEFAAEGEAKEGGGSSLFVLSLTGRR